MTDNLFDPDSGAIPPEHTQRRVVDVLPPDWVAAKGSLAWRWWEFHLAHPEVERGLVSLARQLLNRGYKHLGIGMLWETLRYHSMLGAKVPDEDVFRLNNSNRAYYARFLMEQHADLDGVFETRALTAS